MHLSVGCTVPLSPHGISMTEF